MVFEMKIELGISLYALRNIDPVLGGSYSQVLVSFAAELKAEDHCNQGITLGIEFGGR